MITLGDVSTMLLCNLATFPRLSGDLKSLRTFHNVEALTFEDLSKEVCIIFIVEGRVAAEQDVGDDSNAPDIHSLAVWLLCQHLRGHIAGGATGGGHHPTLLHLGQPEVADHDLAVGVGAET